MINIIVITAVIAWAISQISKVFFGYFKYGKKDIARVSWRLIWASGMPSSHSAMTTSVLAVVGIHNGINSDLFGLTFVLTCIVIYDRSRMQKIFIAFQENFPELKKKVQKNPELSEIVGHSTSEIIAGCMIGLFIGFIITKFL